LRSIEPGDIPTPLMAEYYRQRASAGLIISEATQISAQAKGYADEIVLAALEKLRKGSRQNLTAPATMTDWRPIVHEMRLFKS
ncbi:hypothetical protein MJM43_33770, partial [Salmonella enterica subsp. enterica serovar Montevideo]|nr:hypothetical protein [Salmonella enterica subsp. enterica serovar Montevideo]